MPVRRGPIDGVEDAPNLFLHEIAEALPMTGAQADCVDDAFGRGETNVGRDQQFFERLNRIDVDRPAALLFGVGLLDDLFETTDDLLFGARQALAKLVKKSQVPNQPRPSAAATSDRTAPCVDPSVLPEARRPEP